MNDSAQPSPSRAEIIHALCSEAEALIGHLGGPLQSVTLEAGDCLVKVEWEAGRPSAPESHPAPPPGTLHLATEGQPGHLSIVAPLVGTFYRCPEPGAPPLVQEGELVEANQKVAIIEAMKIMNAITSPSAGRVAQILVQDGEMVEFEQVLMHIEPIDDGP